MNNIPQEKLIEQAIERAKQLNTGFNGIDKTRLEIAAKEHVETGKDYVDGICFWLSYND